MMVDLKVMAYFKLSLSTHNWDRAFFKWVGPLFRSKVIIYQPPSPRHKLKSLDDLRHLPRVGVVLGNADDERLTREGYTNLVRYQSLGTGQN